MERAKGDAVVVLMRQERLKPFVRLWQHQNGDYFATQQTELAKLVKATKQLRDVVPSEKEKQKLCERLIANKF